MQPAHYSFPQTAFWGTHHRAEDSLTSLDCTSNIYTPKLPQERSPCLPMQAKMRLRLKQSEPLP